MYILLLPLHMVWGLQVPFLKRFGITIILMTGLMLVESQKIEFSR